jgi:hypothetical protein
MTEVLLQKLTHASTGKISRHEVPSLDDVPELVRANFGIGVWPLPRRAADDLIVRELQGIELSRWIHIYSVAGRRHSVAAATLIKLLRVKEWSANGLTRESIQ